MSRLHSQERSTERLGELLIILSSALWGLFPVLTKVVYGSLPAFLTAALSALFALPVFLFFVASRGEWKQFADRRAWRPVLLASIFIGILYYGFMFSALRFTSAGNVSILSLMEIFISIGVLRFLGREYISQRGLVGAFFMFVGAAVVLFRGQFRVQMGDLLVLCACFFPPFGNYYAKQALQYVSSSVVMTLRSAVSVVFFLGMSLALEDAPTQEVIEQSLTFLAINGIILFGFCKILWLEAIARITISKALCLGAVAPAFTLLFAYLVLGEIPSLWQVCGLVPIAIGVGLLTRVERVRSPAK